MECATLPANDRGVMSVVRLCDIEPLTVSPEIFSGEDFFPKKEVAVFAITEWRDDEILRSAPVKQALSIIGQTKITPIAAAKPPMVLRRGRSVISVLRPLYSSCVEDNM